MRASAGRSDVHLHLLVPARVHQGEPVRFSLRIVNAGERPATVYFQGRPPAFDVTVHDASGRQVWRRLEGAIVAMVLGIRELAPGEWLEFEDSWRQTDAAGSRVPPGRYRLTGLLPGEPGRELRSPPVEVEILPSPSAA
jgi:intracellular proteinase inhibitor BsuPI